MPAQRRNIETIFGFALAVVLQGGCGFLVVPLAISVLGPSAFARMTLIDPLLAFSGLVALFGGSHGYLKFVASEEITATMAFRLGYLLRPQVHLGTSLLVATAVWLYLGASEITLLPLFFTIAACEAFFCLALALSRAERRTGVFTFIIGGKAIGPLIIFFLAQLSDTKLDLCEYYLLQSMVLFAITLPPAYLYGRSAILERRSLVQHQSNPEALRTRARAYGMPLVIATSLTIVASNADRYVLFTTVTAVELAAYLPVAKLAGLIGFVSAPINLWWPAERFRKFESQKIRDERFNRISIYLTWGYLGAAFLGITAIPFILPWYSVGISDFDPYVALTLLTAAAIGAATPIFAIGQLQETKTHLLLYSSILLAVSSLITAAVFGSLYGARGAALGPLISQLVNFVWQYRVSQSIDPVRRNLIALAVPVLCYSALSIFILRSAH